MIIESDDDFGLDDDIDDPWDDLSDDIDYDDGDKTSEANETDNHQPDITSKKQNFIKPLLLVCLLGGGVYISLSYIIPQKVDIKVPIIKIPQPEASVPYQENFDSTASDDREDNLPEHRMPEPAKAQTPNTQIKAHNSVLTPMPETLSESTAPLPTLKNSIATQNDVLHNTDEFAGEKKPLLIEEELLSKTETVFQEEPKLNSESPSTPTEAAEPLIPTILENLEKAPESQNIEPPPPVKLSPPLPVNKPKIELRAVTSTPKVTYQKWVIRAAQVGSAVIYDKNSKEMKSVEVNDIVNGVGRIKSIKIIDGNWVIIGTLGKIEQ